MGVPTMVKYTTLGLKKGRMVAVASRFWGPKMTGSSSGMPTSKARLHTIFAVELAFGMWRKRSRSKAQPMTGPSTTTDTRNASNPGQLWYSVSHVNTKADA